MTSSELVSIVIPCYRQAHYLNTSIESALGQTHPRVEVIVVNDGSDDDTREVAGRYASRIRYIEKRNGGLSSARNAGIAAARGEWIQFLDADDWIVLDKVEKQLSSPTGVQNFDVLYCDFMCFSEDTQSVFRPDYGSINYICHSTFYKSLVFGWERGLSIPVHSFLFRRSCFSRWGCFETKLRNHEDWNLYMRFSAHGARFCPTAGHGAIYRVTAQSMSRGSSSGHTMRIGKYASLELVFSDPLIAWKQRCIARARFVQDWTSDLVSMMRCRRRRYVVADLIGGLSTGVCLAQHGFSTRLNIMAGFIYSPWLWRALLKSC